VHRAVISGINEQTETVTVEWFENEETKGKELDVRHIAAMNSDLAPAINRGLGEKEAPPPRQQAPVVPSAIPAPKSKLPAAAAAAAVAKPTPVAPVPVQHMSDDSDDDKVVIPAREAVREAPRGDRASIGGAVKPPSNCVQAVQNMAAQREQQRIEQQYARERNKKQCAEGEFAEMIDSFLENVQVTHLPPNGPVKDARISVCVRKRPLNSKERKAGEIDVVTIPDGEVTLVHEPKTKVDLTKYLENHNFRFDYSFDETADNAVIYHYSAKPLVKTIFDQGMATCFAYGQVFSLMTPTTLRHTHTYIDT
jgi:kinesin family protein 2/24